MLGKYSCSNHSGYFFCRPDHLFLICPHLTPFIGFTSIAVELLNNRERPVDDVVAQVLDAALMDEEAIKVCEGRQQMQE